MQLYSFPNKQLPKISHFESVPYLGRHLWRARVNSIWVTDFSLDKAVKKVNALLETFNTPSTRCAPAARSSISTEQSEAQCK